MFATQNIATKRMGFALSRDFFDFVFFVASAEFRLLCFGRC